MNAVAAPTRAQLLDNIVWHALAGRQKHFSSGTDTARRFARGFSPIIAFADPRRPAFDALAPFCEAGEHFYCAAWTGEAPDKWRVDEDSGAVQFVWDAPAPPADPSFAPARLGAGHVAAMMALVALTRPGPFGERTVELGEYVGLFDGGELVAMAGERMAAGNLREISGVCTHPEYRGRGLARRLMHHLIRRELQRGEVPFLHVMRSNAGAIGVYEHMGFRRHQEIPIRVVTRLA